MFKLYPSGPNCYSIDSLVETNLGSSSDPDGITLDVNDDGWDDFKIYPSGYHALSGNAYGMTIKSLNDSSYFATTVAYEFNICILYRPYGGQYVSCKECGSEFSKEELVSDVDTVSQSIAAKYVEAFSPGNQIHDALNWEQAETHFFKRFSAHRRDQDCWPESKWGANIWRDTEIYFVPIKQITSNGPAAFGWIKLQYGGENKTGYLGGSVPHAYVYETYLQRE